VIHDVTDPDADATCAALQPGTQCEPWYITAPEGFANVGACLVPD
jgi:hypothetical protein